MNEPNEIFIDYSCRKLTQLSERVCACLDKLEPAHVWRRGSDQENAIGNLVLHLCGNVRQWIGFGVGGQADVRKRDAEFAARDAATAEELKIRLRGVVADAVQTIRAAAAWDLTAKVQIQGYEMTVLEAIYHVVEHFSGHTGQIIFATKLFSSCDLGFYRHLGESSLHREKLP